MPHTWTILAVTGGTVRLLNPCQTTGFVKGLTMLATILSAAVIFLLVAAIGMPYKQTWYGRWNPHR